MKRRLGTFAKTIGKYIYNEQYDQSIRHGCNEGKVGDVILVQFKTINIFFIFTSGLGMTRPRYHPRKPRKRRLVRAMKSPL